MALRNQGKRSTLVVGTTNHLHQASKMIKCLGQVLWGLLLCSQSYAQSSGIRTYCNPLDINYQYNFEQMNEQISYRSGADPVIEHHKGEYYLFSTIALGWWHSKDLIQWEHITPYLWHVRGVVAPAALSVRDTLYLLPSTYDRLPLFYTTDPYSQRSHGIVQEKHRLPPSSLLLITVRLPRMVQYLPLYLSKIRLLSFSGFRFLALATTTERPSHNLRRFFL